MEIKPVVNVSWNDAIIFCNLLAKREGLQECYSQSDDHVTMICNWNAKGYRLPTEAEWQYACKAGTNGYRYGELEQIGWSKDNSDGETHDVGAKHPNA